MTTFLTSVHFFLPDSLAREMAKSESMMRLEGERVHAVILFSDIRSFTALSESMQPEEVITFLNAYFAEMIDIVFKNNGTLDKLIGDGMMALFGAFNNDASCADNALMAAIEMLERLQVINKKRESESRPPIEIGIGIHYGEVVIGGVGTENRMDFTALGDTVNTASSVESLTRELGDSILISSSVREKLRKEYAIKEHGLYEIRGRQEQMQLLGVTP